MWESIFNILKILGALGAILTVVIVLGRMWSAAGRERYIKLLESELKLSQEHCEQCDKDVKHYREEMRSVRDKCEGEVKTAQANLEDVQAALKTVELENVRLKARPDLTSIEQLLQTQQTAMEGVRDALTSHIAADAKIFESIDRSLSALPDTLKKMNEGFDKRQKALLKRMRK